MKVYKVLNEWSTDDGCGTEIKLFAHYEKAKEYFDESICNEMNPDMSWAGTYFKDGEFAESEDSDITLDTMNATKDAIDKGLSEYWNISDSWGSHTYITLSIEEVIE